MKLIDCTKADDRDYIVNSVAAIEKECFYDYWSEKSIDRQLSQNSSVFGAVTVDNVIAGYVFGQIAADECEIYRIAVSGCFRRRGIAEVLMGYFINECRRNKVNSVFLEVRADNFPAVQLYEKYGFKKIGIRRGYYKIPICDAINYSLSLI